MKSLNIHRHSHGAGFARFAPVHVGGSAVAAWLDRQRQRVHLARLDARLLADIGVSRGEADREARRRD